VQLAPGATTAVAQVCAATAKSPVALTPSISMFASPLLVTDTVRGSPALPVICPPKATRDGKLRLVVGAQRSVAVVGPAGPSPPTSSTMPSASGATAAP
jgi:hypothetical protein